MNMARLRRGTASLCAIAGVLAIALGGCGSSRSAGGRPAPDAAGTVWLCLPGTADDPCTSSLATTVITAAGKRSVTSPRPTSSRAFDCFYVYPTVSQEQSDNADLRRGQTEIAAAGTAAQFSAACQLYAPIYRQVTSPFVLAHPSLNFGPAQIVTTRAYDSIRSGFEDFLAHYDDGRPFIVIGDSQGSVMLELLLARLVDNHPAVRRRLVLAILLGGNVEVPTGRLVGGTFKHIPACDRTGESGCVIAYSSFPSTPPADALFGRAGQGISLQSGQTAKLGRQVVCVNPAALGGGEATLDSIFPSQGAVATPWAALPGLYAASCEQRDGASWLNVTKATGPADHRPTVRAELPPQWGYHLFDLPFAQSNLDADVTAAEATWKHTHH